MWLRRATMESKRRETLVLIDWMTERSSFVTASSWRFRVTTGKVWCVLVWLCPCVCVCVCTLDSDRLSDDCSFLNRALLVGFIDCICRGKGKKMTNGTPPNVPLHFPLKLFSSAPVKRPKCQHLLLVSCRWHGRWIWILIRGMTPIDFSKFDRFLAKRCK